MQAVAPGSVTPPVIIGDANRLASDLTPVLPQFREHQADLDGMNDRASWHPRASLCVLMLPLLASGPAMAWQDAGLEQKLARAARLVTDGDFGQADAVYRDVLRRDSESEEAIKGLQAIAQARPLPSRSGRFDEVRSLLPTTFKCFESEHFIALSGADAQWTRQQLESLESAFVAFGDYADELELDAWPLAHKLVCVFFASRREYADFGLTYDRRRVESSFGYYSLPRDRTVLFSSPDEDDFDEFGTRRLIAAVVHEAIHHLHYHTGVQSRFIQYPLWATEGLATVFETNLPSGPMGPDEDFAPRRRRFERLVEQDRILPLSSLVRFDSTIGLAREQVAAIYNQSYALMRWLMHTDPDGVRTYLAMMRREPPGRPTSDRHLEIFEAAFGDVRSLDVAWLRHELATIEYEIVAESLRERLASATTAGGE